MAAAPERQRGGKYQLSMRFNGGAWMPPGLAMTEDGYGGQVGVVVVN